MTIRETTEEWAARSRERVVVNEGDYRDENGFLICGVCGKPKESVTTYTFDGEPVDIVWGKMCDCEREALEKAEREEAIREAKYRAERMREAALMDKRLMDATFENSEINSDNEKAFQIARRYVDKWEKMEEINQGLLFYGEPGTGKSHLAACIANALIDKGVRTVMTSCIRLTDMIFNSELGETEVLGRINKARLLILDDVGTERLTEYSLERLYSIIDSRYRACKPLIVTTNLTLDEMKNTNGDMQMSRIYSRVLEMCSFPVKCTGKGYRRKATAERYMTAKKLLEED